MVCGSGAVPIDTALTASGADKGWHDANEQMAPSRVIGVLSMQQRTMRLQVGGTMGQQAAPAEAMGAGQHHRVVQQPQADGTAILLLQLIGWCSR